jgi:hypothetical protein
MQLGLRAILLVVAIILFIIAAISSDSETAFDFLAIGLACIAGALVVEELGLAGAGGRLSGGRRGGV